jgi:hypothetical protein
MHTDFFSSQENLGKNTHNDYMSNNNMIYSVQVADIIIIYNILVLYKLLQVCNIAHSIRSWDYSHLLAPVRSFIH